jgi:hypothetical protein
MNKVPRYVIVQTFNIKRRVWNGKNGYFKIPVDPVLDET